MGQIDPIYDIWVKAKQFYQEIYILCSLLEVSNLESSAGGRIILELVQGTCLRYTVYDKTCRWSTRKLGDMFSGVRPNWIRFVIFLKKNEKN